jgi:hypothetical protein
MFLSKLEGLTNITFFNKTYFYCDTAELANLTGDPRIELVFGKNRRCNITVKFAKHFNLSFDAGDVFITDNQVDITVKLETKNDTWDDTFITMNANTSYMITNFNSNKGNYTIELLNLDLKFNSASSGKPLLYPLNENMLNSLWNSFKPLALKKIN